MPRFTIEIEVMGAAGGALFRVDEERKGIVCFLYGDQLDTLPEHHRRGYSHDDAVAVAEMVNASSWPFKVTAGPGIRWRHEHKPTPGNAEVCEHCGWLAYNKIHKFE